MRSSLSLFLLLATPSITYAQCTKDTDCKGDRICEKGICTAPPATSFQTRNAPQPSKATDDLDAKISRALEDQLRCISAPEPGKALRALHSHGYIGNKPALRVDGMNIYTLLKPLSVFGYKVREITGWEEDGDKTLFWRGPGTAPPLHILAVVDGNPTSVKADLERRIGGGPTVDKATFTTVKKVATEIICYGR
jgi:hypothetical protein